MGNTVKRFCQAVSRHSLSVDIKDIRDSGLLSFLNIAIL